MSVFGCDLDPLPSISDYYTFASGSAGAETTQLPNVSEVSEKAAGDQVALKPTEEVPFAAPNRDTPDLDLDTPISQAERDAVRQGNIIDEQGNVIGEIA